METIEVGILGGSGYGGSELLRLLWHHPGVSVKFATAHSHVGKRIDSVHPNLRGFTELVFEPTVPAPHWEEVDVLFLAMPHGMSMDLVPSLPEDVLLIDLAGDYRLRDISVFSKYYGEHRSFGLQTGFVYGLTEMFRDSIRQAKRVANPGCFATAALLGTFPMLAHQLTTGKIVIDAKTGSSGSGNKPKAGTHHPQRANSFYAYKFFQHRHLPEIRQGLEDVSGGEIPKIVFQTHSVPMVRGIFATIYCTVKPGVGPEAVSKAMQETYGTSPFVRLVEGSPNVNWVKQTNFADIGWAMDEEELTVCVAIDNLVKGAAGQAIQNMNLMLGWEEARGLRLPGTHP